MSNKSRYTGNMWFRGKVKKNDPFQRKVTRIHSKAGTLATRTLAALANPRPDGKPHRDTTTFKRRTAKAS